MKRILTVILHPVGGIRSYLRYTYEALPPGEWTSTVLTIDVAEAHLIRHGLGESDRLELVANRNAAAQLALKSMSELQSRRYALAHSQGATAGIIMAPGARAVGVPHVVTLHETFRAEQFAGLRGALTRQALLGMVRLADAVVLLGDDALANFLEFVPLPTAARRKIHIVRNGVPVEWLMQQGAQHRPNLRMRLDIGVDVTMLGFLGRFMPDKGFDLLIQAVHQLRARCNRLPPFRVVAVNDGAYLREYRQQIAALDLSHLFSFVPLQPSAAGVLRELDVVVMPSRREACGLVAMEALVLGCPLVAADCVGLREVTKGTPALTARTEDASSLAAAIADALTRRHHLKAAAAAFMPAARQSFDVSNTAQAMATLFRQVMARPD